MEKLTGTSASSKTQKIVLGECSVCLEVAPGSKVCGKCKVRLLLEYSKQSVRYCGRSCQAADWKSHKNVCGELKEKSGGRKMKEGREVHHLQTSILMF
jgi:hypothetical protein